jgi:hypothetical protein
VHKSIFLFFNFFTYNFLGTVLACLVACTPAPSFGARSVHRPRNNKTPKLTAYWDKKSRHYTITDSHIKEYPIFNIKAEQSHKYLMPDSAINFRYQPTEQVDGAILKEYLETMLAEIKEGKKTFTHFDILRSKDFNFKKQCGLIIVKYKKYPFVVKLSIERPETFVNPYCKGIVPTYFFFMAGGSNRHMTGLTRIPNLHKACSNIQANPKWKDCVKTPRKWFWLPKNNVSFYIKGTNIGVDKKSFTTQLPSVYAIIADAIDTNQPLPISEKEKNKLVLQLCNDLNLIVDPHEDNFVVTIDPVTKKLIITIVDTEHFPTIVGIRNKQSFTGYVDFYLSLAYKAFNDIFLRTKDTCLKENKHCPEISLLA